MSKKLEPYKGKKLNPNQIAEGFNLATGNVMRIASDANLLVRAGRYPAANAIASPSIERAGKVIIY